MDGNRAIELIDRKGCRLRRLFLRLIMVDGWWMDRSIVVFEPNLETIKGCAVRMMMDG